jgi:hypothetical protein
MEGLLRLFVYVRFWQKNLINSVLFTLCFDPVEG